MVTERHALAGQILLATPRPMTDGRLPSYTTTTVDIAEQVRAIDDDLKPLLEFKATLESELKDAELQRPTPTTHNDAARATATLAQLTHGTRLGEEWIPGCGIC